MNFIRKSQFMALFLLAMAATSALGQTTLLFDRATLGFNLEDQNRTLEFESGGVRTETVNVSQVVLGPYLSIGTTSMLFSSDGNTQSIVVQSNTAWTVAVTGGEGWLTVTPDRGSNDGTISVTATTNTGAARNATVTITWTDNIGTMRIETVAVRQNGERSQDSLIGRTTWMQFSSDGNTQSITVSSNTAWTVAVAGGDGWLMVTPVSGTNDGIIQVTVAKNTTTEARTASITVAEISGTVRKETVQVQQAPPGSYLSISTNSMQFSSDGNTQSIVVQSNTSWAVSKSSADWLTITPASGSNDETISVTAVENSTGAVRTAIIAVNWIDRSGTERKETVHVIQEGNNQSAVEDVPVENESRNSHVYDLLGRPVVKSIHGIYIIKKKKVIEK